MISEMKIWCEGVIVAIILSIIIESLIPECNNKKYIKVVIGIYIMYISLNPILKLLDYDFKINLLQEYQNVKEVSNLQDYDIKEVYIDGIEQNLKKEIEELGYKVNYINVYVDVNYENIELIEVNVVKDILKDEDDALNYDDIYNYIVKNYLVDMDNIKIK